MRKERTSGRLVVAQAARLTAVGAAIGLAGALAASRLVASLLFGVTPFDVTRYAVATAALASAAFLTAWLPARRRVSPLVALTTTSGRV